MLNTILQPLFFLLPDLVLVALWLTAAWLTAVPCQRRDDAALVRNNHTERQYRPTTIVVHPQPLYCCVVLYLLMVVWRYVCRLLRRLLERFATTFCVGCAVVGQEKVGGHCSLLIQFYTDAFARATERGVGAMAAAVG